MINVTEQEFSYIPKILNGAFAGIVGVSFVFPIDLIKTRLQNQKVFSNNNLQYNGIFDCAYKTWKNGGVSTFSKFKSLYSGSGVNILLITPEKAIKLVANDFFRYKLSCPEKKLSTFRGMLAGGLAGFCQVIVTTPMELLKIQMQRSLKKEMLKPSASALALQLLKEKGIFGLYRGIGPTIARDVTFSVIYFPLFAQLNSLSPKNQNGDSVFYGSFFAGIVSGATASFLVTPLDVIKTRIQLIDFTKSPNLHYNGMIDTFLKIIKFEGPKALFKGAVCRMLVMAPLFGIAQMVYFFGVAEYCLGIKKTLYV